MLAVWWNASSLKSSPFPSGCTSRGRDQIGSPTGMRERATGVGTELYNHSCDAEENINRYPQIERAAPGGSQQSFGTGCTKAGIGTSSPIVRSTPFCYVWYFCTSSIWLSHALVGVYIVYFAPPKKL